MRILGVFHFPGYSDPSAALVVDGEVLAFVEEERLVRNKHALAYFPQRAIDYVLREGGLGIEDLDAITTGWDCEAHESGVLAAHFADINRRYPPTAHDLAYQKRRLESFTATRFRGLLVRHLRKRYGDRSWPHLGFVDHHLAHAVMAYFHSAMDEGLVLTLDGSGEWATTVWWHGKNGRLERLSEVRTPHSLGWFYSAFTEYLGFEAYDGEYKVMGLAAYGREDEEIADKLERLVWSDGAGGFLTDPTCLAMGPRSFSSYFPDTLVEHMGRPPRSKDEEISQWHMDCAYGVQQRLESVVQDATRYWVARTGLRRLAIAGGVGLNVKMNGNLFAAGLVDDIFIHPLCADTGMAIGSPMAWEYLHGHLEPRRIAHVALGPGYSEDQILEVLEGCKLAFSREPDIGCRVAQLLAEGKIVGWFQGRMEAGPRALGNRSILADPRRKESRDRVNGVVKFREFWRPFCPSMTRAGADVYLERHTEAPFMIITFDATERAAAEVPAVVHVDGTSRVQVVDESVDPLYHRMITCFAELTGVPAVLNTSLNIKGEPIVCTPHDAVRTYFATGLDALAIGPFLLEKSVSEATGGEPG